MKIIFLDMDGVLNNNGTYKKVPDLLKDFPEPIATNDYLSLHVELPLVELLNGLISQSGAEVILSSTWRRFFPDGYSGFQELMESRGFCGKVVGMTPPNIRELLSQGVFTEEEYDTYFALKRRHSVFENPYTRGHEIMATLLRTEDVESFVILDDIEEMDYLEPWLVRTDPDVGLTAEDVEKALGLLENRSWRSEIDPSTSKW